jgi:formylglycine-generating enzyme required for sulfatase activity
MPQRDDFAPTEVDGYRIIRHLAYTSFGSTFVAHDRRLDRAVLLRLLPSNPTAMHSILQAARALARVSHPAICAVHRVRDTGERPYIVSSFVRGVRLGALALPLTPELARSVGRALSGAVAALHAAGVAHGRVRVDRVLVASESSGSLAIEDAAPASAPGSARLATLRSASLVGLSTVQASADADVRYRDVRDLVALLAAISDDSLRERIEMLASSRGPRLTAADLRRAVDHPAGTPADPELTVDNPYRGLLPFDTKHADLFHGRQSETGEVVARLRDQPWLVVAGRSGAGKSSLVLAGVVPQVADGALGERTEWEVATVAPGSRLRDRVAGRRDGAGLLVVVDPLEDALVLGAADREAFLGELAKLGTLTPGLRVLLTIRSEFLDRLGTLGPLGSQWLRATYLLPAMGPDGLRAAIVSPARSRGFTMESPAMVDALAADVGRQDEGLPLLSFVLSELWRRRDRQRRVLSEAALADLGGAAAALAKHGDTMLASMRPRERKEARRILVMLASAEGSARVQRPREELLAVGAASSTAALDALVESRLVVAGTKYQLSHAALAKAWPRLRLWLDEASDVEVMARQLEMAAVNWLRQGRRPDALLSSGRLREIVRLAAADRRSEAAQAFLSASRAAVRRRRMRRWAARLGPPLAIAALALGVVGVRRLHERRQAAAAVAAHLSEARSALAEARHLDAMAREARASAFQRYDANDPRGGEAGWREARLASEHASSLFAAAATATELALAGDPLDAPSRRLAADVLYGWILLSEDEHQDRRAAELRGRLELVDLDGARSALLKAPARLRVATSPPGAHTVLHRIGTVVGGRRVEEVGRPVDPKAPIDVEPGSYVLEAEMPDRYTTRLPLLLRRGQEERVELSLPRAADVPPDFVYVPPGWSLFGASEADELRLAVSAQPEHPVYVPAFLVATHETTVAEYLAFVAALPPAERDARRPANVAVGGDGAPVYVTASGRIRLGEALCRPKRKLHRCQDWLHLPVDAIAWDDAQAYARWVAADRMPGARLCTEREWERAARGADGRGFPQGDDLHSGDANFQSTYDVDAEQMGPDEVGSFPSDRSVFGVFDLAGNVAEWVGDTVDGDDAVTHVARGGGGFNVVFNARSLVRHLYVGRSYGTGVRLCAAWDERGTD